MPLFGGSVLREIRQFGEIPSLHWLLLKPLSLNPKVVVWGFQIPTPTQLSLLRVQFVFSLLSAVTKPSKEKVKLPYNYLMLFMHFYPLRDFSD